MNDAPNTLASPDRRTVIEAILAGPHDVVAAGTTTLAHWRFGSGPDVVLVHGWPLHSATWRAIVPALAKRFTVHLFDLPGVGWSPPLSEKATFDTHARALRAALDTLGLERYALVAHDSGAVITRLVAADNPSVWALVMGNTELPGHEAWQLHAYVWAAKIPGLAPWMMRALRYRVLRSSPLAFGGCFADASFHDLESEFGALFIRPIVASSELLEGQLALVRGVDFATIRDLRATHERIRAPALLVWGPDDPFFPIAKARRILEHFKGGARLAEIPGKLFAHEEQPDAFCAHVEPFLVDAWASFDDQSSSSLSSSSSAGLKPTPLVCTAINLM